MALLTLGLNHHTAPLALREQVAFASADTPGEAIADLSRRLGDLAPETAILSTCNRTEVYCTTEPRARPTMRSRLARRRARVPGPATRRAPLFAAGQHAVKHAFRVASGLDSMVLGEPQILGQLKQAVRSAEQAGTLGLVLHKLFQQTFSVAKEVRSRTQIGEASVSMAAAAVRLAERIYPSISEQRVLFIGAGEMIELCAAHFAAQRPRAMTFANRTAERAQELATRFEAGTQSLNDLPDYLASHDIVVACTASQLPIIGKGLVERALKARRHLPMLMIDLAVPRDVEAEVGNLEDIFLYSVDDLGGHGRRRHQGPAAAIAQAEAIIETQVDPIHDSGSGTPPGGADHPRLPRTGRRNAPGRGRTGAAGCSRAAKTRSR